MFVYINGIKILNFKLQTCVRSTVKYHQPDKKKFWIHSILKQINYVQQTKTCKIVLIVVTSNQKGVQHVWNRVLHISITLKLPSIVKL